MKRYWWAIVIIIALFLASCYYDNEEALYPALSTSCDTTNVTYSGTIAPLLSSNCTICHSGGTPSGSVTLTSYSGVQSVAASGMLMNALKGNGVPLMPPSGVLSACKKSQVQVWINKGMLNN